MWLIVFLFLAVKLWPLTLLLIIICLIAGINAFIDSRRESYRIEAQTYSRNSGSSSGGKSPNWTCRCEVTEYGTEMICGGCRGEWGPKY